MLPPPSCFDHQPSRPNHHPRHDPASAAHHAYVHSPRAEHKYDLFGHVPQDTASRAASDASALESAGVPLAAVARALTDETQFVTTNDGVPLAYDSLGKTGPVVVLVHGWSGSRHYFELNARVSGACRLLLSAAVCGARRQMHHPAHRRMHSHLSSAADKVIYNGIVSCVLCKLVTI